METTDRAAWRSLLESRRTVRLKGPFAVTWTLAQQGLQGSGVIQDLNAQGLSLQLDREFQVRPGQIVLSLQSSQIAVLPTEARVRWFRRPSRKRVDPPLGLFCGCIFIAPTQGWIEWYRQAIAREIEQLHAER